MEESGVRAPRHPSGEPLGDNLKHNLALPRPGVAVNTNHLLPCPECHFPIDNRDGDGRSDHGGLQVGGAIIIMPGVMVMIPIPVW